MAVWMHFFAFAQRRYTYPPHLFGYLALKASEKPGGFADDGEGQASRDSRSGDRLPYHPACNALRSPDLRHQVCADHRGCAEHTANQRADDAVGGQVLAGDVQPLDRRLCPQPFLLEALR